LAVRRIIQGDGGIVSSIAEDPIFHADEPGADARLAR
jgi:hypothetical protein